MGYAGPSCLPGKPVTLKGGDIEISATVIKGPFYKKGTAKIPEGSHART
ncbi:MAG: hypothetical protein V1682_01890 [Candidatus Omnitrophota bacterium]